MTTHPHLNGTESAVARELRRGTTDSRVRESLHEIESRLEFWLEGRTPDELNAVEDRLRRLTERTTEARRRVSAPPESLQHMWVRQFMALELIVSQPPRPIPDNRPITRFEHAMSHGV